MGLILQSCPFNIIVQLSHILKALLSTATHICPAQHFRFVIVSEARGLVDDFHNYDHGESLNCSNLAIFYRKNTTSQTDSRVNDTIPALFANRRIIRPGPNYE